MTQALRKIANARRDIPAAVHEALKPLEETSHQHAVQSAAFATLLLASAGDAALPLDAGADVIRLAQEASRLAAESRVKLGQAHQALRSLVTELFGLSGAACPPNEGSSLSPAISAA